MSFYKKARRKVDDVRQAIDGLLVDWHGEILVGLLAVGGYPLFTHWMMSWSEERSWLSSFVEASIAFNSAVLFSDVRKWFVNKFRRANTRYKSRVTNKIPMTRDEESVAKVAVALKKLEAPLSRWLLRTTSVSARLCFMEIILGCLLLLLGCPKWAERWMPMLLWFFVLFYATMEMELILAKRRSRDFCQSVVTDSASVLKAKSDAGGAIAEFSKTIPSKRSEDA